MSELTITPHLAYNWMIVAYFFLGGLGAGAFLFSVTANYWMKEYKPLAKTSATMVPMAIAIGLFFLLLHLGKPLRVWRLFISFNPHAPISWGFWFINIFFVLSLLYAWYSFKEQEAKGKIYALLGVPFAFVVAVYTGFILAHAPGEALWHSAIVPVLFLVGGLISGITMTILVSNGRKNSVMLTKLGRFVACLVLFEFGMIFNEIDILFSGGTETSAVAKALFIGQYSMLFWGVQIVLGGLIPVFILFKRNIGSRTRAVALALILIGIYVTRHIIVIGGQTI